MSCCLDTNHIVGTHTFFRIILWIFTLLGGGGVNCSRQDFLSQFVLCYLATILFCQKMTVCFFKSVEEKKKHGRMCGTQMSILGLLANDPATVSDGCHGHHAVLCYPNRFIFRDNMNYWYSVVQLKNFASISNCPMVQNKSNMPPPLPRCVRGG